MDSSLPTPLSEPRTQYSWPLNCAGPLILRLFQLTHAVPTCIVQGSTGNWSSTYVEGHLKLYISGFSGFSTWCGKDIVPDSSWEAWHLNKTGWHRFQICFERRLRGYSCSSSAALKWGVSLVISMTHAPSSAESSRLGGFALRRQRTVCGAGVIALVFVGCSICACSATSIQRSHGAVQLVKTGTKQSHCNRWW